jgi:alkanesulfonate monooxygenase SsuD/methylene tetrahydromethanopterin reductase-like flavin-dependent oxidoreductase (luciferase family)
MFLESFEILKRALSGERFVYHGKFWTIDEPTEIFPKPIQKPHPPFYMAAISPASYDLVAENNISLLRSPQFADLGTVAESYGRYAAKMKELGHDADSLDQPFSIRTFVAPTDEEARAETKHVVWSYHLLATLLPGAPGRPVPKSGYENYPRDPSVLSQITEDEV